jgi:DNA-binding IclR family transcriptional regulator
MTDEVAGPAPERSIVSATGTQALDRGIEILRALVPAGQAGLRLIDVQNAVGLTKPTAHRLLAALARHGFVEQDESSLRYRLAYGLVLLGSSVWDREAELRDRCHQELLILAEETGDTAHYVIRSGYDSMCIDRCLGSYPIKVFTVEVGERRPLGVGASGLALLSAMPDAEIDEVLRGVSGKLSNFHPLTEERIRHSVAEAKQSGYAVSAGYGPVNVRGIGVPISNGRGLLSGALSIAAVNERIPTSRVPEIADALLRRRDAIVRRLAEQPAGPSVPAAQRAR